MLYSKDDRGVEQATLAYINMARAFDLTVSLPKTNVMMTGYGIEDGNGASITVGEGEVY